MSIQPSAQISYVPVTQPLAHPDRHRENRRETELKLKISGKRPPKHDESDQNERDDKDEGHHLIDCEA